MELRTCVCTSFHFVSFSLTIEQVGRQSFPLKYLFYFILSISFYFIRFHFDQFGMNFRYLALYQTNLYLGISLPILVYLGLSPSIMVCLGLSLAISVFLCLSWSISIYLSAYIWLSWAISSYLGLSRAIPVYFRLSQAICYLTLFCYYFFR